MTSDLNIFINLTLHLSCFVFIAGLLLRTVLGHMNFWPVFVVVEIMKISFQLNIAVMNVSCLLQFSVIMNFDWVHRYGEKVKLTVKILELTRFPFTENPDNIGPSLSDPSTSGGG